MPLLKPSTPPKKTTPSAGKILSPKKGETSHSKPAKGKPRQPPPALSFWDQLSAERKLDVLGVGLAFLGIVLILGLLSTNRSEPVSKIILFFLKIFGWGFYVLPLGLLVFGLWLVFRKIERIPPLSVERAVGSVILFLAAHRFTFSCRHS